MTRFCENSDDSELFNLIVRILMKKDADIIADTGNTCPMHFYASMMHERRIYRDECCDEWTFELFDSFGLG